MSDIVSELRAMFDIDPDGTLRWKVRRGSRGMVGDCAGWADKRGRVRVTVRGRDLFAHRIVFAITRGYFPDLVDHINGDPTDNKPSNLREANFHQNSANRRGARTSKSGIKGVSWERNAKLWRAVVTVKGVRHSLGYFKSAESASAAWNAAASALHGEFFRPSVVPPGWTPPPECKCAP